MHKSEEEQYLLKIIDAYVYKKDIDGAISFLEKDTKRTDILYELYKTKKNFSQALISFRQAV